MAIRDTWNRMVRKSVSSTSSGGHSVDFQQDGPAMASGAPTPAQPNSTRLDLSKMVRWRSKKALTANKTMPDKEVHVKRKSSPKRVPKKAQLRHPSEKPLTQQNLKHQELLGGFTMKFGRNKRLSRLARGSISATGTRDSVMGMGMGYGHGNGMSGDAGQGRGRKRMSSMVPPEEGPIGEEEDS